MRFFFKIRFLTRFQATDSPYNPAEIPFPPWNHQDGAPIVPGYPDLIAGFQCSDLGKKNFHHFSLDAIFILHQKRNGEKSVIG